ncbi:hypothetical protein ACC846_38925, partial [Rhizobium ruizarguesonis]
LVNEPPHLWLAANGGKGLRLGIDPLLHAGAEVRRLERALSQIGGTLVFSLASTTACATFWMLTAPSGSAGRSLQSLSS